MSNATNSSRELAILKKKLSTAQENYEALEIDFKCQMTLLTQFISKLSQTSKGIDILLDNKLAKLRALFTKSAKLAEIEALVTEISALLQKHSTTNEQNIWKMHEQFQHAGITLQKINGLPSDLRRQLRTLLSETASHKDALIAYVPLLSQLLSLYDAALKAKIGSAEPTTETDSASSQTTEQSTHLPTVSPSFIKRFIKTLNSLTLSASHAQQIADIKANLDLSITNDKLIESVLTAFDVLVEDLQQEKNTAKVFLYTLSETLTSVQSIVKNTLSSSDESFEQQQEINQLLKSQLTEMAQGVDVANSLAEIKADISKKLTLIANAIDKKMSIEQQQQQQLAEQLKNMTEKVNHLEAQSVLFEKRIQDQRAKSMQDALTKLANRAAFDDYFSKKMVLFHQQKFELAITVLDLDDFKSINDTFGHTAGDKTLQVIANTLKKEIGDDAFICRYGGEEFVLIFSHIDKEQVMQKLNSLREKIARLPFKFKNNKVTITTSIGVCHVKQDDNIHLAFDRADTALYQAKAQGKNMVVYL